VILFLKAVGLALALEGALYALFPSAMKRAMTLVLSQPAEQLRYAGLAGATLGVGLIWLAQRFL
jgi:uncharacterized protein YjeT (DUF2065 family)